MAEVGAEIDLEITENDGRPDGVSDEGNSSGLEPETTEDDSRNRDLQLEEVQTGTDVIPRERAVFEDTDDAVEATASSHVILADDTDSVRRVAKMFSEMLFSGASIEEFDDGQGAIGKIVELMSDFRAEIEMVISDQMMINVHGTDVYNYLRNVLGLHDVPFLLVSGGMPDHMMDAVEELMKKDPLFKLLPKPYNLGQFKKVVGHLMETRARVRAETTEN
jgi:CheY-like chemotaxis protein